MMSESQKIISVMLVFFVGMFILTSISDEVSKKEAAEPSTQVNYDARQDLRKNAVLKNLRQFEFAESKPILYDVPLENAVQQHLIDKCSAASVDPKLMLAIIEHESRFQTDVVSATHDYGLCQINRCHLDKFYSEYGDNIFDPYANISYGVDLLDYYMGKADGDERLALLMYQYGETGAKGKMTSRAVEEILSMKEGVSCLS